MAKKDLSTLLLESNLVNDEQLIEAEGVHKKAGLPLGRALVYLGYISQKDLIKMIATQLGLKFIDFKTYRIERAALQLIPEDFARKYLIMPVTFDEGRLVVAMTNPKDVIAIDELKSITGYEIEPAVSTREDILGAIEKLYKEGTIEDELIGLLEESERDKEFREVSTRIDTVRPVDLSEFQIDPNAVMTISENMARKNFIIPVGFEDNQLLVAMSNTNDVFLIDNLRITTGYEITPLKSDKEDINDAISRYYKMAEVVEVEEKLEDLVSEIGKDDELGQIKEIIEDAPIVKLVNLIISRGVKDRASDIHIEPQEGNMRVRYRIDGVLHESMKSPKRIQSGILSRVKIMANMDIA
ncbi:MAG: Flp pilus assembly complex ATPase component TadA, partial [Actinomycetia bacterium]|nr:Flp pilus assembly complex ATPase component TadA [Actinomycetes bacterium]